MGSAKSQVDRNTANTVAIYHLTGAKPCGNHALLLDENVCVFFLFNLCCCENAVCTSSMGRMGKSQAKCALLDGQMKSSFIEVRGLRSSLFPRFVVDGEFLGVVVMFSLQHSLPKGTFGSCI